MSGATRKYQIQVRTITNIVSEVKLPVISNGRLTHTIKYPIIDSPLSGDFSSGGSAGKAAGRSKYIKNLLWAYMLPAGYSIILKIIR